MRSLQATEPFGWLALSSRWDLNFVLALLGAIWLHLILLFVFSFAWPQLQPPPASALEVILLKELAGPASPHAAESALAQRDQAGESARGDAAISAFGDASQEQGEIHPPEPPQPPSKTHQAVSSTAQTGQPTAPQSLAADPMSSVLNAVAAASVPPPAPSPRIDAAQILASQGLEVARLSGVQSPGSGGKRQRRRSISASTREFRYASYLDAWAKKVERIGNLNYPQAAREQGLYGSLILHVAVRKDGSVEGIRVVRSSGIELLDRAAIQIVEIAAPFSPFPPDIAAETDVLDIVRTWQFTRGDLLSWGR